jgi:hypothetical protein
MPDKLLDSERQLLATDRGLKPGVDHRDHEAHLAAVAHKGSQSIKQVRRTAGPDRSGTVRVIGDK